MNDNPNTHTPEEMQRIEEYKQAVDPELVVYYDAVKNGEQNLPPYPVAQVSRRMADTIKTLTGMDVSDNTIVLDKNGVEHINRRHGKQGKADKGMANSEDVGRIKYVLEHFDGATLEPTFAKGYSRKNGKPAPKVVFYKKINGTYYVVEAASDANTKKNYIVSAYINKKIEGGQPLDVQAPKITSEPSTTNPSDKSIPHFPEKSTAPRLYTRAEVQGMSAGEVRENYDAVRKSMEMWDENGELQGGTQSRMVDRQAPGEDNETTSGNERLYTRAEVQRMSEEEQLANVDAIRESMGLWDAEGKLSKESEITIEEVRDDFEQIKHIKNLENFVEDPLLLKDVSPETLYCFLEKQGYTILPLAQSKTLTGIHYKDGGGFKVNWGGDRILQYHPATGSHHNGAYYKISSGKTGKVRIDLHGNKI